MTNLIIAVIALGFTVVFCEWLLNHRDVDLREENRARRRLLKEIRRHDQ